MKMAKASEADLKMAMDLTTALESFERYRCFPEALRPDSDDLAPFDADNGEHCREAMEYLLKLVRSASLMRVVWGMAVVCDPRNEVVDPDADTLEAHPKVADAEKDAARLNWLREFAAWMDPPAADGEMVWCVKGRSAYDCAPCDGDELVAAIDAQMQSGAAVGAA